MDFNTLILYFLFSLPISVPEDFTVEFLGSTELRHDVLGLEKKFAN